MAKAIDFTGQRFGRLVAVNVGLRKNKETYWHFRCDCGTEKELHLKNVRCGRTQSCGCKGVEQKRFRTNAIVIHGRTRSPEYAIWRSMKARCLNENHEAYPDYGGRGIKVCQRWLKGENGERGFSCFIADMGRRPAKNLTIDRVDNDGNYDPENCRWATRKQQARNRRGNRTVSVFGELKLLVEIASEYGIGVTTVLYRLDAGWTPERAVSTPVRKHNRRQVS